MRIAFLSVLPRLAVVAVLFAAPAVATAQSATPPTAISATVAPTEWAPVTEAVQPEARLDASPSRAAATSSMATPQQAALRMRHDAFTNTPAPLIQDGRTRTNTALMLVGLGTLLVGAAVGDDAGTVLIVGGAVIGFYGLYRFLNGS